MHKIILHSDLNNFYASVERVLNPALVGAPIAVCGNEAERKGIVLAKSEEAKSFGVKTGDTVWQAKKKCPAITILHPHFEAYMDYSRRVKKIYARYTDLIEGYGIDECWLDVTDSTKIFPKFYGDMYIEESGQRYYTDGFLRFLGDEIRNTVKEELSLTVSVGVSFNKIYAKLGSDLKKPDGTTVISVRNYKTVIFGLPIGDLLMVGGATEKKLKSLGYATIGALAGAEDKRVVAALGKFGQTLLTYARGEDSSPVRALGDDRELKSIGNSMTCPKDLTGEEEVRRTLYVLSESVAARLRESGLGYADTVHLWVRDWQLANYQIQKKVRPTSLCGEIAESAFSLFKSKFTPPFAVRALGVTVSGFDGGNSQLSFEETNGNYSKKERAERCVDEIRKKYGYASVQRGIVIEDPIAAHNDIKGTHLIKPARFEDDGGGDNGDGEF